MKPIIYLLMLVVGMVSRSYAQDTPNFKENAARDEVFTTFMKAHLTNDVSSMSRLIDKDAVICIPGKIGPLKISKMQYLEMIKQAGKEQQECTPSYEILSASPQIVIARVDFSYQFYIIQNLIKAQKTGNRWKIVELTKTFPPEPEPVTVMQ